MNISGKFDVTLTPIESLLPSSDEITMGKMSLDKTYHGALSAMGKGEMISAVTSVPGSAGYVAMEVVTGELNGKSGSFVLQHYGAMSDGDQTLTLEVVPNSGTGQLASLSGSMSINIIEGIHHYVFEYLL